MFSKQLANLALIGLVLFPAITIDAPVATAQKLQSVSPQTEWAQRQRMVVRYLVDEFKTQGIRIERGAVIEVGPMVLDRTEDWLLAEWYMVTPSNPNGIAGQIVFTRQGRGWDAVGAGNYIQDVNTLVKFGVPQQAAEDLSQGSDR